MKIKAILGTLLVAVTSMLIHSQSYAYTVLYKENFENGFNDMWLLKKCRDNQYNIIKDPSNSGNKIVKLYQPGTSGCKEDDGSIRKRTYMVLGPSVQMHNLIKLNRTYNNLQIVAHQDYWIGFRFNVDPATPDGRAFILASAVGEPAILLSGNDTLDVIPERYKTSKGLVENHTSSHKFAPGKWHTLLVHWKKGLMKNKDGVYEVWLDGKQIVDKHNIIAGTDRAGGAGGTVIQTGIYFGTGNRKGNYTMLMDDIAVVHGTDGIKYPFFGKGGSVSTSSAAPAPAGSPPEPPVSLKVKVEG